jgi:tRNA pseudouridine38-40 synthase
MRNIRLTIAYNGSRYVGWQVQAAVSKPHASSIQGKIEQALRKLFQKKTALIGSGRTDSGVHAIRQVANFKTDSALPLGKIKTALNGILPQDIVILEVEEAASSFHSRFDAKSKTYRYIIVNQAVKPAFVRPFACWVRMPLDVKTMRREAKSLLGRHDFKSFQGSDKALRGSITTIEKISVKRPASFDGFPFLQDLNLVVIDIQANGFLRSMVRNIVGTLIEAGKGRIAQGEVNAILKKKDRSAAGPCAPACGLYLLDVRYEQ